MKTCGHTTDLPKGTKLTPGVCGVCWLWANRPRYVESQINPPKPPAMQPCLFEDESHCRLCWLWFNSESHRIAWEKLSPYKADPNSPPPTVRQMVGTLQHDVDEWVRAGKPMTPPDILEDRKATCRECDQYDAKRDICKKCGCSLSQIPLLKKVAAAALTGHSVPPKLEMATAKCPLGKWDRVPLSVVD